MRLVLEKGAKGGHVMSECQRTDNTKNGYLDRSVTVNVAVGTRIASVLYGKMFTHQFD